MLVKLRNAGKLLAVASGNLEVVGWHKLESAELSNFFTFGCFADDCETREEVFRRAVTEVQRRLQPKSTVCFMGDTPSDIRAARQVGAQVIAVATGIYKLHELLACGPDACLSSCAELLETGEN